MTLHNINYSNSDPSITKTYLHLIQILSKGHVNRKRFGPLWTTVAVDYCFEWIIVNATGLVVVFL